MKKEILIHEVAFSQDGRRPIKALVQDEKVYVWDSTVGHYTSCHILSKKAIQRAIEQAKKESI